MRDDLDDHDDLDDLDDLDDGVKFRKVDTCFGLTWSTLICLGLHALSQITIERLKCSKAISGMDGNLCRH